jgi:hypothetical protein
MNRMRTWIVVLELFMIFSSCKKLLSHNAY